MGAYSGIPWHTLAYCGILWHILAYSGILWHTLAYSGILWHTLAYRGGICQCRQCRRQCKIFASSVNFSLYIHFLCFFLLKLLKLGEIDDLKFVAGKFIGVIFLT